MLGDRLANFVAQNARKLNDAVAPERDREFEYFGLRTIYDRYLLKHPRTRLVIETPQQFFLRIACALAETVQQALELYAVDQDLVSAWANRLARRMVLAITISDSHVLIVDGEDTMSGEVVRLPASGGE